MTDAATVLLGNDAATPPPAAPNAAPLSVSEADAQITRMTTDKAFRDRLLSGDVEARAAWKRASEAKANGSETDALLDGTVQGRDALGTVENFRNLGLTDAAIRQALDGTPVSKSEYRMAKVIKAEKLSDREFTKKWSAGDVAASREMLLLNIILTNGVAGEQTGF